MSLPVLIADSSHGSASPPPKRPDLPEDTWQGQGLSGWNSEHESSEGRSGRADDAEKQRPNLAADPGGTVHAIQIPNPRLDHQRRGVTLACVCPPLARALQRATTRVHEWAVQAGREITQKPIIYFTKHDSARTLSTVVRYVLTNEQRRWIKFVRVVPSAEFVPDSVPMPYAFLQEAYPELTIECVTIIGTFGPHSVRKVAAELHVPYTFIFMGTFDSDLGHSFTEMGGLRIITADDVFSTSLASHEAVQMKRRASLAAAACLPSASP